MSVVVAPSMDTHRAYVCVYFGAQSSAQNVGRGVGKHMVGGRYVATFRGGKLVGLTSRGDHYSSNQRVPGTGRFQLDGIQIPQSRVRDPSCALVDAWPVLLNSFASAV